MSPKHHHNKQQQHGKKHTSIQPTTASTTQQSQSTHTHAHPMKRSIVVHNEKQHAESIKLEAEVLQSIYGNDFILLGLSKENSIPLHYQLRLMPSTDKHQSHVTVLLN